MFAHDPQHDPPCPLEAECSHDECKPRVQCDGCGMPKPEGVACLICRVEALRIVHGCYDDPGTDEYHEEPCDLCPDDEARVARRAPEAAQ